MVTFYKIEVAICWMGYKLARRVRERDGVLLELHAKLWYLEDASGDGLSAVMVTQMEELTFQ
jgi:hypothetical protein